jgi:hypothetical protein
VLYCCYSNDVCLCYPIVISHTNIRNIFKFIEHVGTWRREGEGVTNPDREDSDEEELKDNEEKKS